MIPYVPVVVVSDEVFAAKAIESGDYVLVVSDRTFKRGFVCLADLSALLSGPEPVESSGRKIVAGTIYALECEAEAATKLDEEFLVVCRVLRRKYFHEVSPKTVADLSIPIDLGGFLTRADERYISRPRVEV